jgi:hypothetical protein
MGTELGTPCVTNLWIPDGSKDIPADRKGPRERLKKSLDEIFAKKISRSRLLDAVESKLFGIGSESYVVGSHEFYLGYAIENKTLLCLDTGHFHPTEVVSDKISSVMTFLDENPAARQQGRQMGQRPCGDSLGQLLAYREGSFAAISNGCTSAWTASTPASTASPG